MTTSTKCRKWNRKIFTYMIDVSRTNAQCVWSKNKQVDPRMSDSYEFMFNLAVQLVMPLVQHRNIHSKFLTSDIKRHISNFILNNSQHVLDQNQNNPGVVDQNVAGYFHLNIYNVCLQHSNNYYLL